MLITIPAIGKRGITGQSTIKIKSNNPAKTIIITPTSNKINLEQNPIIRETSLSINAWNFKSSEPELVVSAEICRYGLNNVRISESIEKKSDTLKNQARERTIKTRQPFAYHQ